MSYKLYVENLEPQQVQFKYSVGHETLLSLHVLSESKHHSVHIPWVVAKRRGLSSGLKEQIERFRFLFRRPIPVFWPIQEIAHETSFQAEMEHFRGKSTEDYVRAVCSVLCGREGGLETLSTDSEVRQKLLSIAERKPMEREYLLEFVDRPDLSKERLVNCLTRYWEEALRPEWPRLEEMLQVDMSMRQARLAKGDVFSVFDGLTTGLALSRDRTHLIIRRFAKAEIHLPEGEKLYLVPSTFVWPHTFIQVTSPIVINYAVEAVQKRTKLPAPPLDTIEMFRSLGDVTRVQIVQLLRAGEKSTSQLANLLGLSEAAVSAHLKMLQKSGIVATRRVSYYVFYKLDGNALRRVQDSIGKLFEG